MTLQQHISNKIKELRQGAGLSQEELAKLLKVATNTISRWETATYHPRIEDLEALARALKVPILSFFPREDEGANQKVVALLRAAEQLKDEDIDELQKYAEFRRARSLYIKPKPSPGRKRKNAQEP